MKKDNEQDVIAAAVYLYSVCKKVLADSIGNNGRDLRDGRFLSPDAVGDVREAIHLTSPEMTPRDKELTATGICRGLVMAVRFIEEQQHEIEGELVAAPVA